MVMVTELARKWQKNPEEVSLSKIRKISLKWSAEKANATFFILFFFYESGNSSVPSRRSKKNKKQQQFF